MTSASTPRSSGSICRSASAQVARSIRKPAARRRTLRRAARARIGSATGCAPGAQEASKVLERCVERCSCAAVAVLERSAFESLVTDHDAMGDAEQLAVGKLDSWTRVAVVEQHAESGGLKLRIELFRDCGDACRLLQIDRDQGHIERRQRFRPDDA